MLDMFFKPEAIAVIGASANPSKLGHGVLSNLIESGYGGDLYPINLRARTILGLRCYPSVLEVPGPIDLVVVVVPSRVVASVLEESGQKGVKGAIIISAGFKEAGGEGASMEQDLLDIANRYGMRIIGPNCLGIIVPSVPMNASFASGMPQVGTIAFTSQSGALCTAILDYALAENIGFSHFVSLGNKADVDEAALLTAWAEEEQTNVVIAYVEGLNDGRAFMAAASQAAREKPVIAVKAGRTASGARAVSSHTGSLAGSDAAYDAAFAQSGVIRAASVQELFDYSTAFAYQPLLQGNRIAIITNAGGPGVMATDALEQNGLVLAQLGAETKAALEAALPPAASIHNPVDVLGDARAERYGAALKSVLEDQGVDGVIVILTPQLMTEVQETAKTLIEVGRNAAKPVMSCWMGKQVVWVALDLLARNQIPNYPFPERAISALGAMYRYWSWRRQPTVEVEPFDVDRDAVATLFESVKKEDRKGIGDAQARHILEAYGIAAARSMIAAAPEELIAHCREIGYPVVLKIASPDILHKSDVGGIIMGVKDDGEARQAFDTLIARAKAHKPSALVWGVQVQEMVANAREVIIGMNRDPQFGPLVMFGLGGIYVEVLRDVAFRVAPMTRFQAEQMVRSIRSYALLAGVRGEPPADLEAIVDAILRVSQLVTDFPEIAELDINPLLVRESGQGAVAVDMRLILG